MKEFHGKRIWNRESKRDWLIWSNQLYASNLIIIGGFEGGSAKIFSERLNSVKKAHVYEPVPQFYGIINERIKNLEGFSTFNEAVYDGQDLELDVSGDASLIRDSGREIPEHLPKKGVIKVKSVTAQKAVARILEGSSQNEYSLYMNCEGSEYRILEDILRLEDKPRSLVFQTHTSGEYPYEKLFALRANLSSGYVPVLTADWAWDVWVRRDLVRLSPSALES